MSNNNPNKGVEQQRTAAEILESKIGQTFSLWKQVIGGKVMSEILVAMQVYASQFRASTGLKWVKATERLPLHMEQVLFRPIGMIGGGTGGRYDYHKKMFIGNGLFKPQEVEWLDESTPSPSLADTQYISQLKQNNESLLKELTAQEQRIGELEYKLTSALVALKELVDLKELKDTLGKTASYEVRQPKAWQAARNVLLSIEPTAQVSDIRDGDSKANPDQQKPDLAEQLRAMNPFEDMEPFEAHKQMFENFMRQVEAKRVDPENWNMPFAHHVYNYACNKLNEIINK